MRIAIALCVVGLLAGTSLADVHTHVDAKVSLEIPSGWDIQKTRKIIVGSTKDKAVGLMFWVVDRKDADASIKLLDKFLTPILKDVKWDKPKEVSQNGLKGAMIAGSATRKGKPMVVMTAILAPTPTGKGVLIYTGIEKEKFDAYEAEIRAIFASIKATE